MKPRPFLAPLAGAVRSSRATAAWARGTGRRRRCWGHPGRCGGRGASVLPWGAAGLEVSRCWGGSRCYRGPRSWDNAGAERIPVLGEPRVLMLGVVRGMSQDRRF